MVAVGFAFFVARSSMANNPVIFTIGIVLNALYIAVLVHMLLAFPTGRLDPGWSTRLVVASYALCLSLPLALALFREDVHRVLRRPDPRQRGRSSPTQPALADAIDVVAA